MLIGFNGGAYTDNSLADEECINLFRTTVESQGAVAEGKAYGGTMAQPTQGLLGTPGLEVFCEFPEMPVRGDGLEANGRVFKVAGASLYEVFSDGTFINRGAVGVDANPASLAFNGIQILVVSAGHAYCFTLATNALLDVTSLLAGTPIQCAESDTYFIVIFANSNKFQMSQVLDGTTWPGTLVNEVSVFPENITSIIVNHRELWVFGLKHCQPYQDTGSLEVFDVIPGALIEKGNGPTFSMCLLDNSVLWIDQDERGGRMAWRSNGYTPQRISTHAVEIDLALYSTSQIAGLVSYSCQINGHLWWVLYIPNSSWSWVYDIGESLWFKMAYWQMPSNGPYTPHRSWNHVYAFGKHLVGDWNSGNLYEMHMAVDNGDGTYSFVMDAGNVIRSLRRAPTVENEMSWITHADITIDMVTGLTPQPPFTDGDGNDRPAQCMLRWSDNRGKTWSNEHTADCGFAGQYNTRVIFRRLGRSRYRVYEWSMTDPVPRILRDAYLRTA